MMAKTKDCRLKDDWRNWSEEKCMDRLFMVCPACGKRGCHVELRMTSKECETGMAALLKAANQALRWLKATHNWEPINIEGGKFVIEALEQAIAKAEQA